MVSKRSSGSRSGSHRPSQVPKSWSEAVPATMKSLARSMQPMLSKLWYHWVSLCFIFHSPQARNLARSHRTHTRK